MDNALMVLVKLLMDGGRSYELIVHEVSSKHKVKKIGADAGLGRFDRCAPCPRTAE